MFSRWVFRRLPGLRVLLFISCGLIFISQWGRSEPWELKFCFRIWIFVCKDIPRYLIFFYFWVFSFLTSSKKNSPLASVYWRDVQMPLGLGFLHTMYFLNAGSIPLGLCQLSAQRPLHQPWLERRAEWLLYITSTQGPLWKEGIAIWCQPVLCSQEQDPTQSRDIHSITHFSFTSKHFSYHVWEENSWQKKRWWYHLFSHKSPRIPSLVVS